MLSFKNDGVKSHCMTLGIENVPELRVAKMHRNLIYEGLDSEKKTKRRQNVREIRKI
jgi:hypothetical protein